MSRRLFALPLASLLALVACSSSTPAKPVCQDASVPEVPAGGSCPSGQVLWADTLCTGSAGGAMTCKDVGDRTCYTECKSDAECTNPCRPYCRTLGFHQGTDNACTAPKKVCRGDDKNDC
jgi:hypothetical protein